MDSAGDVTIPVQTVAGYQFSIVPGESTPESQERWERRVEALANWLLFEWQRQQRPQEVEA